MEKISKKYLLSVHINRRHSVAELIAVYSTKEAAEATRKEFEETPAYLDGEIREVLYFDK